MEMTLIASYFLTFLNSPIFVKTEETEGTENVRKNGKPRKVDMEKNNIEENGNQYSTKY